MINSIVLEILIRKVKNGEVDIEDIKIQEYKEAVQTSLSSQ